MKIAIPFFFVLSVVLVVLGFYFNHKAIPKGDVLIGLGVVCGFFITMPLFLYHRWKNKDVSEYMFTKDSFKKMRAFEAQRDRQKRKKKNKKAE